MRLARRSGTGVNGPTPTIRGAHMFDAALLAWFAPMAQSVAYVSRDAWARNPEPTAMKWRQGAGHVLCRAGCRRISCSNLQGAGAGPARGFRRAVLEAGARLDHPPHGWRRDRDHLRRGGHDGAGLPHAARRRRRECLGLRLQAAGVPGAFHEGEAAPKAFHATIWLSDVAASHWQAWAKAVVAEGHQAAMRHLRNTA